MRHLVDRRIVPEVGDFRLFSRRAIHAIRNFREQHRFMRGMVAWLGLKEAIVPFEREPRAAGSTKYPFFKMLWFAWTAISSFSGLPLRLALMVGMSFVAIDVGLIAYILYVTLILKSVVPGWASIILVQALFSGITLICIGLVGDYISRIYEESKGRPLYVVDQVCNLTAPQTTRGLYLSPHATHAQSR
jgi:polyisoprenyl-phosphate glycosyltransferase